VLNHDEIAVEVRKKLEQLVPRANEETVRYLISDETSESTLNQMATDKAVDGDYVGAMICEVAAKHALVFEKTAKAKGKPTSKPMSNFKAKLTVHQEFLVEEVDDMLCVVDESVLRAGVYDVEVFHRDLGEHVVGVKIKEFKNDVIVKLEARVVEIRYLGDDRCEKCGEEFTKKDINGGRCLTCGSMIS
jgi:hypothetical protein